MPAFSANGYGALQIWCENCEEWQEVRELECSCGESVDLAGGQWKVDGNGHLWLLCDACDQEDPVEVNGIVCDCGNVLY